MSIDVEVIGINPEEAKILIDEGRGFLIDVREDEEWAAGKIPGAIHAPLTRFADSTFPPAEGKTAIFHCRSGKRTTDYFGLFLQVGYENVVHMEEGILGWAQRGYDVEPG
ncbi:rhodanese-like domain-containing protein [Curvivirga sp.]|uniref:rhodanese-like domain-containing protein n=1 Tax=Curvivirga sp. TaxID=2856848 RepID=UPI003B598FFC